MKHTYKVNGMSCMGCQTSVEKALNTLPAINSIKTDLKKGEVVIEMSSHIPIEKLQETLLKAGLHYTIEIPTKKDSCKNQCYTNQIKPF